MLLAALALGWTLGGGAGERSAAQFIAALQAASERNDRAAIAAVTKCKGSDTLQGVRPLTFLDPCREGARVWTGRIPATGDYLIEVVRTAPPGEAVLTYWLTISVR